MIGPDVQCKHRSKLFNWTVFWDNIIENVAVTQNQNGPREKPVLLELYAFQVSGGLTHKDSECRVFCCDFWIIIDFFQPWWSPKENNCPLC